MTTEKENARLIGALWGLYYSIYYLKPEESKPFFDTAPFSVLKAYGEVQRAKRHHDS